MRRLVGCLILSQFLACANGDNFLVVVQSDLVPGSEVGTLDISVAGETESVSMASQYWPVSFRIGPAEEVVRVALKANSPTGQLLVQRTFAVEVPTGKHRLVINLLRNCMGLMCDGTATCGDSGCRPEIVESSEILSWDGEEESELEDLPAIPDGGVRRDASVADATPIPDATPTDATPTDAGFADASTDAGPPDTGVPDAGVECTAGSPGCPCRDQSPICDGADVYCYNGTWGSVCLQAFCQTDKDCPDANVPFCGFAGWTIDPATLRNFPEYVCIHTLVGEGEACAFRPDTEGRVHGCRPGLECLDGRCRTYAACEYASTDERGSCPSDICNPFFAERVPHNGQIAPGLCLGPVAAIGEPCLEKYCDERFGAVGCYDQGGAPRCIERCDESHSCPATSLPGMPATCDLTLGLCTSGCGFYPEDCPSPNTTCLDLGTGRTVCGQVPANAPSPARAIVSSGRLTSANGAQACELNGCGKGDQCVSIGGTSTACLTGCSTSTTTTHPRGGCESFPAQVECQRLNDGRAFCGTQQ